VWRWRQRRDVARGKNTQDHYLARVSYLIAGC
jgi:hypothetical protein